MVKVSFALLLYQSTRSSPLPATVLPLLLFCSYSNSCEFKSNSLLNTIKPTVTRARKGKETNVSPVRKPSVAIHEDVPA